MRSSTPEQASSHHHRADFQFPGPAHNGSIRLKSAESNRARDSVQIITTDSEPLAEHGSLPVRMVGLGPMLTETVRRLHSGDSMSDLLTICDTAVLRVDRPNIYDFIGAKPNPGFLEDLCEWAVLQVGRSRWLRPVSSRIWAHRRKPR